MKHKVHFARRAPPLGNPLFATPVPQSMSVSYFQVIISIQPSKNSRRAPHHPIISKVTCHLTERGVVKILSHFQKQVIAIKQSSYDNSPICRRNETQSPFYSRSPSIGQFACCNPYSPIHFGIIFPSHHINPAVGKLKEGSASSHHFQGYLSPHRERSRQILSLFKEYQSNVYNLFTPIYIIVRSACRVKEEVGSTFPSRQTHDYPTHRGCHSQYLLIISNSLCLLMFVEKENGKLIHIPTTHQS